MIKFLIIFSAILALAAAAGCHQKPDHYTISGNIRGNVFNLPIGFGMIDTTSGRVFYSKPSTETNSSYSITISDWGTFILLYYIDRNMNSIFSTNRTEDASFILEPSYTIFEDKTYNIRLCGKILAGNVSGNGMGNFNRILINQFSSPLPTGNYALPFYIPADLTNFAGTIQIFNDSNNNGLYETGELLLPGISLEFGGGDSVSTNSNDFIITKTVAHITISGEATNIQFPMITELVSGKTALLSNCDFTNY
jgi:hypothetical protein